MKLPAATAVLINAVFTNAIYYKPLLLGILALIGTVASLIGVIIKYNLDPDKLHKPWRTFCADQPLFDNLAAAKVPPVDIFVGVMTVDSKFDRRRVIRETYGTLTTPRDEITGLRFGNVQLKFVLGRTRKEYAHEIAMEMELYNDIVVLDMPDTSKSTKTLNFMRWAAVNATVPVVHSSSPGTIRWKLADYVLKADDDTFIFLDELERRLRMAPRTMAYWGCEYLLTRSGNKRITRETKFHGW